MKPMFELHLPPSLVALGNSCETNCVRDCCGLAAFDFDPFNIICHLKRWHGTVLESDVETLISDLKELVAPFKNTARRPDKVIIVEWNAILTESVMNALISEISAAVFEASSIFGSHKDQAKIRNKAYSRVVNASSCAG